MKTPLLASALLLAASGCAPPPVSDSPVEDPAAQEVGDDLVVSSAAATEKTPRIPENLKTLIAQAKQLSEYYGPLSSAFDVANTLGVALGIIKPQGDAVKFQELHDHLDRIGTALDWQQTRFFLQELRGDALTAMDLLKQSRERGEPLPADVETLSLRALNAITSGDAAFERIANPKITEGNWTKAIKDRPSGNHKNMVYDWRAGLPYLMEFIAYRLQVIAATNPDFRVTPLSTHRDQLLTYRDFLLKQYRTMEAGVKCGASTTHQPIGGGHYVTYYTFACADVNTGLEAWHPSHTSKWDEAEQRTIYTRLRSQVMQQMPLHEVRSMIDLLYLYAHGSQDLTPQTGEIRLRANEGLCLDVMGGNATPGTPVQVWHCNTDGAQGWYYDRTAGTIRNTAYGLCLDVFGADSLPGTTVGTWHCNGHAAQKWSWDAETGVLQNGLGTVLDVKWGQLAAGTPVWSWPRHDGVAQAWTRGASYWQPPRRARVPAGE